MQPEQPDRHGRAARDGRAARSTPCGATARCSSSTRRTASSRRGARSISSTTTVPLVGRAHVLEGVVAGRRCGSALRSRPTWMIARAGEGAAAVQPLGADASRGHDRARLPRRDGTAGRGARRRARAAVRGARRDRRASTCARRARTSCCSGSTATRTTLWKRLLERDVLVRDFSSWPRVEGCLRVTVGTPAENDAFLAALGEALPEVVHVTEQPRAELGARRRRRRSRVALAVDGDGTDEVVDRHPVLRPHARTARQARRVRSRRSRRKGDLDVDLHHTVEDVGIVLGNALREALGDKRGVRRFANSLVPLDEALVQVALDLSGRPFLVYDVDPVVGVDRHVRPAARRGVLEGLRRRRAASRCTCAA